MHVCARGRYQVRSQIWGPESRSKLARLQKRYHVEQERERQSLVKQLQETKAAAKGAKKLQFIVKFAESELAALRKDVRAAGMPAIAGSSSGSGAGSGAGWNDAAATSAGGVPASAGSADDKDDTKEKDDEDEDDDKDEDDEEEDKDKEDDEKPAAET